MTTDTRLEHVDSTACPGFLWTPIREESGNCYYFEIKREKLYKFFDKKRAGSDPNALEESVRKFSALIIDLSHRTLISLIKGHW